MRSGFPANSVFIVDTEDRVRHHTVLDPRFKEFFMKVFGRWRMVMLVGMVVMFINLRAGWNMDEVARLVAAYRFSSI